MQRSMMVRSLAIKSMRDHSRQTRRSDLMSIKFRCISKRNDARLAWTFSRRSRRQPLEGPHAVGYVMEGLAVDGVDRHLRSKQARIVERPKQRTRPKLWVGYPCL